MLDLKQPAGRDALLKLVATRRRARLQRASAGDGAAEASATTTSRAVNPRIVYAGLFGFGQDGPYAAKPAYDDLMQGSSGLSHLIARAGDGAPRYVPTAIADRVVGLTAVGAILASIVHRDRTGKGQRVDVPMFETMASFVLGDHLGGLTYDPPLDQGGYRAPHRASTAAPTRRADGFISVIVYNDKQWESFFDAIERDDLRDDPRFATFARPACATSMRSMASSAASCKTRTTAEWLRLLRQGRHPGDAGAHA